MSSQPNTETVETNKRKGGGAVRVLAIVLGVLLLGILACGLFAGGIAYTVIRVSQPAADASRAFLEALADDNYDAAYAMMIGGLQSEFGSVAGLEEEFTTRQLVRDEIGGFLSRSINNDEANMSASVTFEDGTTLQATINLRYDDAQQAWLVTGFGFE